ncbi:TPA: hypothetical protein MEH78_005219 [Klebsiella quasipneumoniae subsp. quasipneumoniae]|nr:hypothetical protein [Klebsiella quasipneumoniae subsp. quasipneumoniae]HBW1731755.1 hypothetical protein [Klebsiella quasipneumoniae subsp. quasipneumoniae]HBW1819161.1 hypothetical protein [Klebsiella quasipneumoniae subsp. quasipneumoniae]HCM4045114.1 hypothetical protein [Klebsiella quasipneumoniae subsp. quasipneumoniae]HCM7585506.1 hypothetical protein [Klebsiella quasipneumoniae subsp. quasipneumoniae]
MPDGAETTLTDYLIVVYLTAIAIWPVTLALIGLSAGVAFFTRRRGLGVVLVVLFMLVVITACQFQRYM